MDNKIHNNLSFQARFIHDVKIDGVTKKKLNEVGKHFKKLTEKYTDDTFILTRDKNSANSLVVGLNNPDSNEKFTLYISDFEDKVLQLAPIQIAKKFVKLFRCMKAEESYQKIIEPIEQNIFHTRNVLRRNRRWAKHLEDGKFKVIINNLCKNNKERIDSLEKIKQKEQTKLTQRVDKILGDDEDFGYLKEFYTPYDY